MQPIYSFPGTVNSLETLETHSLGDYNTEHLFQLVLKVENAGLVNYDDQIFMN
jgi:hypothetical protein